MLSIGKMSQAAQVSVKTLRYYDQIGLLKPAFIDEQNGYRYYETDQLDVLIEISRLKRFDFSLEEIIALMRMSRQQKLTMLENQYSKLSREIREKQLALQELHVVIDRTERNINSMKENKIILITPEKKPVLALRKEMGVDDFGKYYGELYQTIAKEQIPAAPLTGACYYDEEFNSDSSDIELFVCLLDDSKANRFIGGQECAMLVHKGGYSNLNETYAELVKWTEENGYQIAGAPYELYVKNGFQNPDPASWETEVYFPVTKA